MEPENYNPQQTASPTPEQPAPSTSPVTAFCRACGKGLSPNDVRMYQGTVYCAEHLPVTASTSGSGGGYSQSDWTPGSAATVPPPPPPGAAAGVSPGLAFVLGLIPGVGAIYNGQYGKGFVHVLITGVLFTLASSDTNGSETFFGLFIPVWFAYMAFEAYHTAKKKTLGEVVDEFSSIFPTQGEGAGFPILPLLLITLGVLFLLNNLNILRLHQLVPYAGPLFLIGLGAYLLYVRVRANVTSPGEVSHERR